MRRRLMIMMVLRRLCRRLRYAPFLSQLVVTRRCNLSCAYCTEFDHVSAPVPAEVLRARIDKIAELGSFGLELTGGEPLLHPDLVALVGHAARHRFLMLGVITNGFLLSERVISGLNDAGLGELQVSVDGVHGNDVTRKALEAVRPRLDQLARLARFKVILSAVLGTGVPAADVETIIRFARDYGFRPRVLLAHGADGQIAHDRGRLRPYAQVPRLIRRFRRDPVRYREQLLARGESPFRCRAGSRYLYIDQGGIVHWCAQTAGRFGIALDVYSEEDLRRQFYTWKPCSSRCTIGCARSCSVVDRLFPQNGGAAGAGRTGSALPDGSVTGHADGEGG
jgi:MoaA/NifB/PqqE/SkfB family radical SAM enzyme